ncbi:MAG: precorrin-3B C(17)-methyltransferase [Lachnospiraceae bacterium]|nr:precorrin-3B C(17)-methyltransferase [Lachnospiraceae bacterium]
MKKITVVGIGPGEEGGMTLAAIAAMRECDILVGYTKYIELVSPLFPEKETFATGMKQETERCREALRLADSGRKVALVCSGDSGIYGMAGLVYELSGAFPEVEIKVVPGVTAASSGAALLGAPLTHDFAVISLSDLLTPWELIEKRLRCAAEAELSIVLYNPSSKKRKDYLQRACDILLEKLSGDTVCGIASRIGREGETSCVMTLAELRETETDMFSTVFIGNPTTKRIGDRMVTPRGYRDV